MALDLNSLNGPQRAIVRDAFMAAYTTDTLTMLLADELDKQLGEIVAPGPFKLVVFNLIQLARAEGWLDQMIAAAEKTSGNPKIKKLRQTLTESGAIALKDVSERTNLVAPPGGLERLVREDGGFAEWGLWVNTMAQRGRQICRIEYVADLKVGGGTGFLVGADLLITNYHVVHRHISGELPYDGITCRFDFAVGAEQPRVVKLTAKPLVDFSTYSPFDPGDNGGVPDPDHLDYALLRLEASVGNEAIAGGGKRGWAPLALNTPVPAANSIVFIGQHPLLEPLKLAVGAIQAVNGNGTRLRYDASTDHGSSGSPVLDVKGNVIALHHGGDPDYTHLLGKYNQGIPIALIVKRAAARGVAKFWI